MKDDLNFTQNGIQILSSNACGLGLPCLTGLIRSLVVFSAEAQRLVFRNFLKDVVFGYHVTY